MKRSMTMKATILLLLIAFALGFLALSPMSQAVVPAPDGGYPGANTGEGQSALGSLTTGTYNTAVGWFSLRSNTEGNFNTAIGAGTLLLNTGEENTATGAGALLSNTTGENNTANGAFALFSNTTGSLNTANGVGALQNNTTGSYNTAIGWDALRSNISAEQNTAIGYDALNNNTIGAGNVALGSTAGNNATTGNFNVYIGAGMVGVAGESGHTYIRNINTTSVSGGGADFVTVDLTTGLLGHASSSRRYKEQIKPMDDASEALFALKPVTFRYKKDIDKSQTLQYGLVAEDVAQVDPDLAIRDGKGQIESVHYNAINAMLLNEFLKEHKKVEEQEATITELKRDFQMVNAQQQNEIQILSAQLKEQAAQIQKVSAQVQMSQPATKVVLNNP
jgi:hypothetical protein